MGYAGRPCYRPGTGVAVNPDPVSSVNNLTLRALRLNICVYTSLSACS